MAENRPVVAELTDGDFMLRVEGDSDAWLKTDDPADLET